MYVNVVVIFNIGSDFRTSWMFLVMQLMVALPHLDSSSVPLCWNRSMETPHAVWTNKVHGGAVLAKNYGLVRKEKETIFCIITRIWFWCILMSDFVELVAEWLSGGVLARVMLCKIKLSASFCGGVMFNNLAGHLYKLSNSYEKAPSVHMGFAFFSFMFFDFPMFIDVH